MENEKMDWYVETELGTVTEGVLEKFCPWRQTGLLLRAVRKLYAENSALRLELEKVYGGKPEGVENEET